jgi:prevent-host-death family protein
MKDTELRANFFKVLDKVARTGIPAEIERKGKRFKLTSVDPPDKLDNLKAHPDCIAGQLDDLIHVDWLNDWKP